MDFSYYNSGLYTETFYTKHHHIDFFRKDIYLFDEVEYNRELLLEHYKEELEYIEDEDERVEEIEQIFWDNLSYLALYFEPLIFDEDIALQCGLTPFEYKGIKLLALSACGMDLNYKLDAYQLLTNGTIDRKSRVFTCAFLREYFENIVGKEITQKILQMKKF
ncbi:MAG TPA: hypothetical protein LFW20_08140 [Rickettsia endosymbiont of Omalisus fontisbellaquei]|nr:hypothetical protein [Rickettsia endosymbiont of Omalisus fontisbellaquei]